MFKKRKEKKHHMNRRDFMKLSGTTAAGVAGSTVVPGVANASAANSASISVTPGYEPGISSVWVPKGLTSAPKRYDLFIECIEDATDFSWLNSGDKILLKLALNSGYKYPKTTDPWLLDCMIKYLIEEKNVNKNNIIVGDQSGGEYVDRSRGSSKKLCEKTGLLAIAQSHGVQTRFFETNLAGKKDWDIYFATEPVNPNSTIWKKGVYITNVVKEVDHIIHLPRCGQHMLADFSGPLKIGAGYLRVDSRADFHQFAGDDFYKSYQEINDIPEIKDRLRLTVTSATKVLATIGPDWGYNVTPKHGLLMASEDILASDVLSYAWWKYNYNHNTSFFTRLGNSITLSRSLNNMMFMAFLFIDTPKSLYTPPISLFVGSGRKLCDHPAIVNQMERNGKPVSIDWRQLPQGRDVPSEKLINKMKDYIKIT